MVKQLYQLQQIDVQITADEQALEKILSQLDESPEVVEARDNLISAQEKLAELKKQQRAAEIEVDSLAAKMKVSQEELYSGRIKNSKELSSLQHEVELMKAKRDKLETDALELMDEVEKAEAGKTAFSVKLKELEDEEETLQKKLSADIEELQVKLSENRKQRQQLAAQIDPQIAESYEKLRKQKGQAIARVEQGICLGCRISLPFSDMQRVRSGKLVQCSSCGRILFLS